MTFPNFFIVGAAKSGTTTLYHTRQAAPRPLAVVVALQVVAGAGLAGQLFVVRRLLAEVLAGGGAATFSSVVPELVVLGAVSVAVSFANVARSEQQRLLSELVARHAAAQVLDVAGTVDLLAFERPEFFDRLQRAQLNAQIRPVQVVNGLLGILGSLVAVAAIAVALLVFHPGFLAIVLAAYVPAWLAANRGSRLLHDFAVHQTERDRRRTYLFGLLSRREEAAEVRSFGLAGHLRDRHDRLFEERIAGLRDVVRCRLRLGVVGQVLTAVLTTGAVALLVWFVTSGRMPAAEGVRRREPWSSSAPGSRVW